MDGGLRHVLPHCNWGFEDSSNTQRGAIRVGGGGGFIGETWQWHWLWRGYGVGVGVGMGMGMGLGMGVAHSPGVRFPCSAFPRFWKASRNHSALAPAGMLMSAQPLFQGAALASQPVGCKTLV